MQEFTITNETLQCRRDYFISWMVANKRKMNYPKAVRNYEIIYSLSARQKFATLGMKESLFHYDDSPDDIKALQYVTSLESAPYDQNEDEFDSSRPFNFTEKSVICYYLEWLQSDDFEKTRQPSTENDTPRLLARLAISDYFLKSALTELDLANKKFEIVYSEYCRLRELETPSKSYDEERADAFRETCITYMRLMMNKPLSIRREVKNVILNMITTLQLNKYIPDDVMIYITKYDDVQEQDVMIQDYQRQEAATNINVQGDYVNYQNNEYLQQKADEQKRASVRKQQVGTKVKNDTFRYIHFEEDEGFDRLKGLFDFMKSSECGWIAANTGFREWESLFEGEPNNNFIVWEGSQSQLKFLFKKMADNGLITPQGGCKTFEILGSHFKRPDDSTFTNWNDYKEPAKRDTLAIERMARYLDIHVDMVLDSALLGQYDKKKGREC